MAECQVPYSYDAASVAALKASLSEPRFKAYLAKAGQNETYAMELYLYNARLAKSFLFPLSVCEVTLRNAVDAILVEMHGEEWHAESNFLNRTLSEQARRALGKAITRTESSNRGKVVATLSFDFWCKMFKKRYAGLWRTKANIAFRGLGHGEGREELETLANDVNKLRNRVAHHEPILDLNVPDLHSKIIKLVKLRCPVTSEWMRHHSTINIVMRARPKADGSATTTLASCSDPRFFQVDPQDDLMTLAGSDAQACIAFVCMSEGQVTGAFSHRDLSQYIAAQAIDGDGLVDLRDHTVADVLRGPGVGKGFKSLPGSTPLLKAVAVLKESGTRVVVATDDLSGEPSGVILRAHRRY